MATNIITAVFTNGSKNTKTAALWQYDYGQVLQVVGLSLPDAWEAHFANVPTCGDARIAIGTGSQVQIPDMYLTSGKQIYCWIFLHGSETSGETVYSITIPVNARPVPSDEAPTPEEQGVIEQLMGALTAAADKAETKAGDAERSAGEAAGSADAAAGSAELAAGSAEEAAAQAGLAAGSAGEAAGSAEAASRSAEEAADCADAALLYSRDAAGSAENAETSADRAEQAAANAGYMFFVIDPEGHLLFERTDQVSAEFSIDAVGHLVLGGA